MPRILLVIVRYFLIAIGFAGLSFPVSAQNVLEPAVLDGFKTDGGTCALVNGKQYLGELRYEPETANAIKLGFRTHVVVSEEGKRTKLYARQVKSFSINNRQFISTDMAGRSPVRADSATFDGIFVQLVDTGKLQLARRYVGATSVGGGVSSYRIENEWLLRRRSGAWTTIPRPAMGGYSSKKFRTALASFFANRSDLLDSLSGESLTYQDVEQAIRAYNSGEATFFLE